MTQITISEQAASTLASAAQSRGCTQEELASMLIEEALGQNEEISLTNDQIARLKLGIDQIGRGETVPGEVVMAKLDALIEELEAR